MDDDDDDDDDDDLSPSSYNHGSVKMTRLKIISDTSSW